jgi:hypothetical protein
MEMDTTTAITTIITQSLKAMNKTREVEARVLGKKKKKETDLIIGKVRANLP